MDSKVPQPRPPRRWKRLLWLLPLALPAYGLVYVRIAEWRDRQQFPQIGTSMDIGGRSLNLFCSGSRNPTVVLESGFWQPGYSWTLVERRLATTNRTCWYDRAGNGWSDPAPGKRFSDSVVSDLHRLLAVAHVAPPYVLVGHSLGGYHVRVFNARYPMEVAGLVLVDPSNEDVGKRIPEMPRGGGPNLPPVIVHTVDFVVRNTGLWRWFMRDQGAKPPKLSDREWATISSLRRQRKSIWEAGQEAPERGSALIAREAGGLDSVPLIVLTRGKPFDDTARGERLLRAWTELSGELAHRSARGSQRIVAGADHFIQYDAPDAVVDAVHSVVKLAEERSQGTQ
jgi:pimeloyl-ACP methyl ester carboxylesterase